MENELRELGTLKWERYRGEIVNGGLVLTGLDQKSRVHPLWDWDKMPFKSKTRPRPFKSGLETGLATKTHIENYNTNAHNALLGNLINSRTFSVNVRIRPLNEACFSPFHADKNPVHFNPLLLFCVNMALNQVWKVQKEVLESQLYSIRAKPPACREKRELSLIMNDSLPCRGHRCFPVWTLSKRQCRLPLPR